MFSFPTLPGCPVLCFNGPQWPHGGISSVCEKWQVGNAWQGCETNKGPVTFFFSTLFPAASVACWLSGKVIRLCFLCGVLSYLGEEAKERERETKRAEAGKIRRIVCIMALLLRNIHNTYLGTQTIMVRCALVNILFKGFAFHGNINRTLWGEATFRSLDQ